AQQLEQRVRLPHVRGGVVVRAVSMADFRERDTRAGRLVARLDGFEGRERLLEAAPRFGQISARLGDAAERALRIPERHAPRGHLERAARALPGLGELPLEQVRLADDGREVRAELPVA